MIDSHRAKMLNSLQGVKANNVQYLTTVTNHNSIAPGAGMGKCTTEIKLGRGVVKMSITPAVCQPKMSEHRNGKNL